MPLKWKIYRVVNLIMLIVSALLATRFFQVAITASYDFMVVLIGLILIFLVLQSIINLAIITKTFPRRLLTGAKKGWHVFSTIINGISLAGIAYVFIRILAEITPLDYSQYKTLVIFTILAFVLCLVVVLFIFICQLTLKRHLEKAHTAMVNSMINSIGSKE